MSQQQADDLLPVDCECATDCGEYVLVTAVEYGDAHREADYVLIFPGHPVRPGSRGPRIVTRNDRYEVVAEGWALTGDEIPADARARLAQLRSQDYFAVSCECVRCVQGPLAEGAQVQITLDEWDRLRGRRLIRTGHPTEGGSELERNDRFVAL